MRVHLCVQRIDRGQVTLDPGFGSKKGLSAVERTRVTIGLSTTSDSLTRFVLASQSSVTGQPLPIESLSVKGHPSKPDEVKVDVTFVVVRLHDLPGSDDDEEAE